MKYTIESDQHGAEYAVERIDGVATRVRQCTEYQDWTPSASDLPSDFEDFFNQEQDTENRAMAEGWD
jgi:hypothetical protein